MTPTVSIQPPPEQQRETEAERAFSHPLTDRRRSTRVKRKFVTQMTPWAPGYASVPFEVVIEDISDAGVGIVHDRPLEPGVRHLLTVPRDGGKPIVLEYLVVRCQQRGENQYHIGLECADHAGTRLVQVPDRPVVSRRLKTLFLLFGIFGLLIASLAPL
jgi:hypothetical protein